jgi:hypothetical protein
MVILLVLLMVGIVPTRSFAWHDYLYALFIAERHLTFSPEVEAWLPKCDHDDYPCLDKRAATFASLFMSTPAVCYFQPHNPLRDYWDSTTPVPPTTAFQSMIVSIFLLALGFLSRLTKMSMALSRFVKQRLRLPLGRIGRKMLSYLSGGRHHTGPRQQTSSSRSEAHWIILVQRPIFALFITIRIVADVLASMLMEVSRLLA